MSIFTTTHTVEAPLVNVKLVGNWNTVRSFVHSLNKDMNTARLISLQQWADMAEQTAKMHIETNDIGWDSLHPDWVDFKKRQGWDTGIYSATSSYFRNIVAKVRAKDYTAFAGVQTGAISGSSGADLVEIAYFLEHGFMAAHLPARPLWQPTFDEVMEWYMSEVSVSPSDIFANMKMAKASGLWLGKK